MTQPTPLMRKLLTIAVFNTVVAVIPMGLMLSLSDGMTVRKFLMNFRFSLAYSHAIGWIAFAVVPWLWESVRRWPAWIAWPVRVTGLYGISLVGGMAACLLFVLFGWIPADQFWSVFGRSLRIAGFVTMLVGFGNAMYETLQGRLEHSKFELRTKELERERAMKLATEAQLASLESRIHPHFLFNALNSISSLIPEDPARAERLVEQMAALLRFSLEANRHGLVPLANEMKIVADYLDIEKARFGDRLRHRIEVMGDMENVLVPPLSVQTLVENSVKYAVAPNRTGGEIVVTAMVDNGTLRLEVADTGPSFSLNAAPVGHGIDTLRARLAVLFGGRAGLSLERRGDRNHLLLTVPETEDQHARVSG